MKSVSLPAYIILNALKAVRSINIAHFDNELQVFLLYRLE